MTKKKATKATRGRVSKSLPFETARSMIRSESLSSFKEYLRWWIINKPSRIPKRPDRTYAKEWQGWNDFLGNNNIFPCIRKKFRPFDEAKDYVRTLKLKNVKEWLAYTKSGNLPDDIPKRPDYSYKITKTGLDKGRGGEWYSWSDWLGTNMSDQIAAFQAQLSILLVLRPPQTPNNVFQFKVVRGFDKDIKDKIQKNDIQVARAYHLNTFDWSDFISKTTQTYYGMKDHYLITNINSIFYVFDTNMARYI